jgi:hypothetical protein
VGIYARTALGWSIAVFYPLITEISSLFLKTGKLFWLGGGYSIDLFLGRLTRAHEDLDFIIKRSDQLAFQEILAGWDLQAADPPGSASLLPWKKGHFYELPVHNIWCRKNETSPWDLEILFSEFEGDEWVYRRNKSIRGPMSTFSWQADDGLMLLAPEIQLLYKSRSKRSKDFEDLHNCLPKLSIQQKQTLLDWISLDSGQDHPWVEIIGTTNEK